MISLNCRGLASGPKKLASKEVIHNYNSNILLFEDMLGARSEVIKALSKFMPGWHIQALDAKGRSRGLALGVKEWRLKVLNAWGLDQVIEIEVYSLELCTKLLILNIYGPCQDRILVWNNLCSKSLMDNQNLVIRGDLNFSLGISKTWGPSAHADPLSDFFSNIIREKNILYINLLKPRPSWRNRRTGEDGVAKRLDRFPLRR